MIHRVFGLMGVVLFAAILAGSAAAQSELGGRPAAGLAVGMVDFHLDHPQISVAFEFNDPVYGVAFTRSGLFASLVRGSSSTPGAGGMDDLDLFDLSLAVSGQLFEDQLSGGPFYLPLALHSTYRRLRRSQGNVDFTAFEYTGIGLGAGVGAATSAASWLVDARVVPGIGLASRSFGNSTGRLLLTDADLQISSPEIAGRFGIMAGYGFRWQSWLVGGPDAFDIAGGGKYTYSGTSHTVRFGISW